MGIGKIGASIGKEIIAWTRTSSKSLLATRPVMVNIQSLKYAPDLSEQIANIGKIAESTPQTILKKHHLKDLQQKILLDFKFDFKSNTQIPKNLKLDNIKIYICQVTKGEEQELLLQELKNLRQLSQVELNKKLVIYHKQGDKLREEICSKVSKERLSERIKFAQKESDTRIPKDLIKERHSSYYTVEEQEALTEYFIGRGYLSQGDAQVNFDKKGLLDFQRQFFLKRCRTLDGIIEKSKPLPHECTVYRSVCGLEENNIKFIESIKEGEILNHKAYTATAPHLNSGYTTDEAWLGDNSLIMRIKLPKGTKGIALSQDEFFLPRGTQLKVNHIDKEHGIVECEYILPNNTLNSW